MELFPEYECTQCEIVLKDILIAGGSNAIQIWMLPFCETCCIKMSRLLRRVMDSMGKLEDNVNTGNPQKS